MKRKREAKRDESTSVPLAWMGWSARIPPEWRPHGIEGEWRKGRMILGDADTATLQIRWWRPGRKRFDAQAWIAKRLRRAAGGEVGSTTSSPNSPDEASWFSGLRMAQGTASPPSARRGSKTSSTPRGESLPAGKQGLAPKPCGFEHVGWFPGSARGEGSPILWYGYAPHADLMIEVVVNSAARERDRRDVTRRVLPSLAASGPGGETRFSLFGASFTGGAGFRPTDWHLHLGDIALRLRSPSGPERGTLLLRQAYPAELALSRRTLAEWLEANPFAGRREPRPSVEPEPCSVTVAGRELSGLRRRGVKRLPSLLGWVGPLNSIAIAVHDTGVGRLLLAEYDSRGGAVAKHEEIVTSAIAGMNWAMPRDEETAW